MTGIVLTTPDNAALYATATDECESVAEADRVLTGASLSSIPVVSGSTCATLAIRRERQRGVWSRADADTTLLIREEVSGILG